MQTLTAVVLGATGLVGEQLVQQLLNDRAFSKVRILVRRPIKLLHPKLEVEILNFDNRPDKKSSARIFICAKSSLVKLYHDLPEVK